MVSQQLGMNNLGFSSRIEMDLSSCPIEKKSPLSGFVVYSDTPVPIEPNPLLFGVVVQIEVAIPMDENLRFSRWVVHTYKTL